MAEERARVPSRRRQPTWTRERIALALGTRRDELVRRLPLELAAARGLTRDDMELVVDEAIDFMVTEYGRPIESDAHLEGAFWATAGYRVKRIHEGRGATVRAGFRRVDLEDQELAAATPDPATEAVDRLERQVLLEFIATLTPPERAVLAAKYGSGPRELGRVTVARELGLTSAQARKIERAIARKLERFVAVVSAGTLCAHRMPQVLALADEHLGADEAQAARVHLAYCPACRNEYVLRLRALRSGDLPRRLAELLPVPPLAAESRRWHSALWDAITDWSSRPVASDAASHGAQAATAARGLGTAAALKLAAVCIGGAAAVGGTALCVQAITDDGPPHHHSSPAHAAARGSGASHREPRLPTAGRSAAVRVVATRQPRKLSPRVAAPKASATPVATATPTSVTTASHEQSTAVSPPATASTSSGEFSPAPATASAPAPAAPATGGGPEFP